MSRVQHFFALFFLVQVSFYFFESLLIYNAYQFLLLLSELCLFHLWPVNFVSYLLMLERCSLWVCGNERIISVVRVKGAFDAGENCVIVDVSEVVVVLHLGLVRWRTLKVESVRKVIFFHRVLSLLDLVRYFKRRHFFIDVLLFGFRLAWRVFRFILWNFRSSSRAFFDEGWKVFILLFVQIDFIDVSRLQERRNILSVYELLRVNVLNLNHITVIFFVRRILPSPCLVTASPLSLVGGGTSSRHNLVLLLRLLLQLSLLFSLAFFEWLYQGFQQLALLLCTILCIDWSLSVVKLVRGAGACGRLLFFNQILSLVIWMSWWCIWSLHGLFRSYIGAWER